MSLLGTASITHRRFAAGSRGSDGRYVEGSSTDTSMTASVQVASGKDLQTLPLGLRTRRTIKVYTEDTSTGFDTADQAAGTSPDHLVVSGVTYEVQTSFPEHPLITHAKCLATQLQESE